MLTWKCASRHNSLHLCSPNMVFLTFWLQTLLRAATACTFWASQLPKVFRTCAVFIIFTFKFASRHNGAQFFISHLPRWLRTRRFSEPTSRPSGATKHWKNTMSNDFSTFSRALIFFLPTLSLLCLCPPLLLHLSISSATNMSKATSATNMSKATSDYGHHIHHHRYDMSLASWRHVISKNSTSFGFCKSQAVSKSFSLGAPKPVPHKLGPPKSNSCAILYG